MTSYAAILVLIPQDMKGPLLIGCCKITPDITPYGMLLDDRCDHGTALVAKRYHWRDIGTNGDQ
jgi:hypothetical protein